MPRKDKTGPKGEGPKTGRGLGDCSGSIIKNADHLSRMGFSQNRSFGRGRNFRRLGNLFRKRNRR